MKTKDNLYGKLFEYLENQRTIKQTPSKNKVNVNKTNFDDFTKDLKIYNDIPGKQFKQPSLKNSKGFNVLEFESLMRAKLIESFRNSQNYERPYISVGELYSCLRQCYYTRMKYTVNEDKLYKFSYLYLILEVGKLVHNIIQELYEFTEIEKVIISEKYKVKGRVDGIKDNYLLEIKTIDTLKFKNTYIKEHYIQSVIYAYILNTEYKYSIDTITLIYATRDLKRIIPFDLPINNELARAALNRAPILKNALNTLKVPEPIGATKDLCTFCLYLDHCKKDKCLNQVQPFKPKYVENNKIKKKSIIEKSDNKVAFLL